MKTMTEARFYEKKDGVVACHLCRHNCVISDGHKGICGVRQNAGGTLYTFTYENCIANAIDPIEKKPLFHFLPGSESYSIATAGCNFRCKHCQNYGISQAPHTQGFVAGDHYPVSEVVNDAVHARCKSISFTYTEPTMFFEYAYDVSVLAKKSKLKTVFVSNGYTEDKPLDAIHPYLDAVNIDLKGFTDKFYREVCGATLNGVLDTLRKYVSLGTWIEVTTLIIPTLNDGKEELRELARYIRSELGSHVPWHVSAFHPTYKLTNLPRTPAETIRLARDIGLEEGLDYVYVGNIPGEDGESTFCPGCGKKVIARLGFHVLSNHLKDGKCFYCGCSVPGIWS